MADIEQPTRRVWIAQCLCPQRHAILAASGEADDREAAEDAVLSPLRDHVEALLTAGTLNPWCGLCKSASPSWTYELGRTRFRSMEEAMPALKRSEAEQALTRAMGAVIDRVGEDGG
jgi:hypothetical protein